MWAILQRCSAGGGGGDGTGKSLLIRGRKGRIAEPERRTGGDPEPKGKHT